MKIPVLATAAALTALLLAGCGGDNSSVATATTSAGGSSATSNNASSATTSGSDSSATTTQPADDEDTTAPSFEGDSNNEFCKAARDLEASDIGSTLSAGEDGDLKGDLEKVQSAINDLKDKAPSEIKDDVNTLAAGVQKIKDLYAKYDYDLTKLAAAAQKDPSILTEFTNTDFAAASARITAYGTQVCGISDDSTETT